MLASAAAWASTHRYYLARASRDDAARAAHAAAGTMEFNQKECIALKQKLLFAFFIYIVFFMVPGGFCK
jgi:hypothetical protein